MKRIVHIFIVLCICMLGLKAEFLPVQRAQALHEKKLILLSVTKENCPYCIQMEHDVFEDKQYAQKINQHYVRAEVKKGDASLPEFLHVKYYPTNIILNPQDLKVIDEFIGYTKPDIFIELLEEVYEQEVTSFSNNGQHNKK